MACHLRCERPRAALLTMCVALAALVLHVMDARAAPEQQRWLTYKDPSVGLEFEYPAGIFTEQQGDPTEALRERTADRAGRIFATADGRATLQIGTFPNFDNVTVDQLRRRAITATYSDVKLDYNRTAGNWYVLSGTRGAETVYERVHFSCNGRRLDVWSVTYPTAEAGVFDAIVDDMARRFRPILANIRCTPLLQ